MYGMTINKNKNLKRPPPPLGVVDEEADDAIMSVVSHFTAVSIE
jgi:hypothetical protein